MQQLPIMPCVKMSFFQSLCVCVRLYPNAPTCTDLFFVSFINFFLLFVSTIFWLHSNVCVFLFHRYPAMAMAFHSYFFCRYVLCVFMCGYAHTKWAAMVFWYRFVVAMRLPRSAVPKAKTISAVAVGEPILCESIFVVCSHPQTDFQIETEKLEKTVLYN